jgi:short-subunit dehydrogenase
MSGRPLALVTGASAGLGAEFARAYARRGCDLILTARRADRLEALAAELRAGGAAATVLPCDLSRPGAVAALFGEIQARGLHVDVLVNNAGYGVPGSYAGRPWQVHADFQQVMVEAVAELCHRVIPACRRGMAAPSSMSRRSQVTCRAARATRSMVRPRRG